MPRPPRRLAIRDLLILVAALAVGASLARACLEVDRVLGLPVSLGSRTAIVAASSLTLVALSLGTLAISLVPPRPPIRRLVRHPGFLSCLAVASNVASQTVQRACSLLTVRPSTTRQWYVESHNYLYSLWVPFFVAHSVALACLIGMLGGLRLRGADWVAMLGRVLGAVWIVYWIVNASGLLRG